MAAPTFGISASNGASAGTVTDAITSIIFSALDSNIVTTPGIQTANPIVVPGNSFEVYLRMKCTGVASNALSAFSVYFGTAPTDNGGSSANVTMYFAVTPTAATPATTILVATTLCSSQTSAPGTTFTGPANTLNAYSTSYIVQQLRAVAGAIGGNMVFPNPWTNFQYSYS